MALPTASDNQFPKVIFVEGAAPGTPPAGLVYAYAKADGLMYSKDDAGVETLMSGGPAGGSLTVEEADGAPSIANVTKIKVGNGDLTDETGGVVRVKTAADAAGGGGPTQAYAGYNTIGGTLETATANRFILQVMTLANDCFVTSIDAYMKQLSSGATAFLTAGIWEDNSGTPRYLLNYGPDSELLLQHNSAVVGDARWISIPMGRWLAAGTYWLGVRSRAAQLRFHFDETGTAAKYFTSGGSFVPDAGYYTIETTSPARSYSIRANTIR